MYTENYKTLVKEIVDQTNKWKGILCPWIGRMLLKCPYYPEWSTYLVDHLPKFQSFFMKIEKES